MIRPRRFAHRGSVVATGFVIDTALVGVAEARRRVLALWTTGAVVRECGTLLVVTGVRPARVRVAVAPGAPLVEHGGMVAAMPLDRDEAEVLAAPGSIVVARGGVAEVIPLGDMRVQEVAAWIDLDGFFVEHVETLAAPPARAAIPAPPPGDVRALAGVAAPDRDAAGFAAGLLEAQEGRATPVRPSWWRRIAGWFADRLAPRRLALPAGSAPVSLGAPAGSPLSVPSRPSLLGRMLGRMRGRIAEALWRSQLGAVLGRRHAAYLRRLLDLFDQGQLDEALRFAIPIGGEPGSATRLGVGVPRPRDELRLSFSSPRDRAAIPIADEAILSMRERYRAAAARLEQQGRIDEAAFVLAELLADVAAAIALLERHERFTLAAQLAAGRGLAPGLVVRLWFLAGDRQRAIDTARRYHAWADAVARLERAGDARAPMLRMLWADHLADAGDFVQAVEVAWPVTLSRALIGAWIDRGIAAEGSAAARLLVKKLIVAPGEFPAVVPSILAILEDAELDAVRRRRALVEELVAAEASPELRTIARPALRAVLRDHGAGADLANTKELLDRLVQLADDAALRADRPAISLAPRPPTYAERGSPIELRWSSGDAGAVPVCDAAVLPGGRLLVALGELGVRMLGRDGRTIAQLDQPAARLVVSDHGTRALAIAPRGQVQRIARLDLIERRGARWCDAECDGGAATFDGDLWIVTRGHEVLAVDTTAARWRAVWGIETEPLGARATVRREGAMLAIEASSGDAREHWYYDNLTLRARRTCEVAGARLVAAWLTRRGWLAITHDGLCSSDGKIELADAPPIALEIEEDLAVVAQRRDLGVTITACDLTRDRAIMALHLEGATVVSLRLAGGALTASDDRGRIVVVDLRSGTLSRDLRVT